MKFLDCARKIREEEEDSAKAFYKGSAHYLRIGPQHCLSLVFWWCRQFTQTHFEAVSNLMDNKLRKGDVWCLVSCSWFKKWRQYASSEIASKSDDMNPGPIDNSDILGPSGLLKKDLVQNVDYKLMPDTAWKLLYKEVWVYEQCDT